MKVIVVLLVTLALAQGPAFGELSDSDVTRMEQMMNAALAPVIAELNELKAELQAVKTELAALKNDVSELKGEVRQQGNRITSLESRMNSQTNALLLVAGLLVTVLLWMLKQQWDARREDNKTITSQQETIVALQAEIERLKLGIVTGQGKPATDNVAS
ncbi:hypothetical protein C6495_10410 [Candidatus Poribacteria bacterium]|nr:MAG: hypothetical protein C6495_10410 [Candidatus Poribacteria bacterium]